MLYKPIKFLPFVPSDMTEEEMVDLALRLSKQEANSATQREQVDDDNMRKAIAESLQVRSFISACLSPFACTVMN